MLPKTNFKPTTNRPLTVLPQPFFRLGWCGNDKPSPRRTFHSIRRSGGVYSNLVYCFLKALMVSAKSLGLVPFFLKKKVSPRGDERETSLNLQFSLLNLNPKKKMNLFLLKSKRNKRLFFPLRRSPLD